MANLSNVITQTVGTSTAGVNLITAPSSASIWTASTITATTTTTAAELPLGPAVSTATKFSLAASAGSAYCDFECPAALVNTKLGLGWFARSSSSFTATITLTLQSFASSANRTAGTSPTAITLQTSTVSGTALQFYTSFDSNSQQFYRLTISFTGLAAAWYAMSQFQVGPGQVGQGAAIGEWQSFTPAWTSTGGATTIGNGTLTGRWRRVGSQMDVQIGFGWGSTTSSAGGEWRFGIASGYNVDSTALASSGNNAMVGYAKYLDNGTSVTIHEVELVSGSNTFRMYANGTAAVWGPSAPAVWASGDSAVLNFSVPIAEWAGSGTVNLGAGAQVEYLSTPLSGLALSRSPDGTVLPTTTPASTIESLSLGSLPWQTPQQVGDIIELEIKTGAAGQWATVQGGFVEQLRYDGTNSIGLGLYYDPSIPGYVVARGKYRSGVSTSWAALTGALESRYRIRKSSASAPVGFGMAGTDGSSGLYKPGQAPGYTGGAITSAGYVGEVIGTASNGTGGSIYHTTTTTALSASAADLVSRTLNKGTYLVSGFTKFTGPSAGPVNSTFNLTVGGTIVGSTWVNQSVQASAEALVTHPSFPIVITADNTTVAFRGSINSSTTTNTTNNMYVVRIA